MFIVDLLNTVCLHLSSLYAHFTRSVTMYPFHKTAMMHLTVISIVNPQTFLIFVFFLCMYIYNTILCIILPLHQITKK